VRRERVFDAPWEVIMPVTFGLILLLLFLGTPVAGALGVGGIMAAFFFLGKMGILEYASWSIANNFIFSAIPLFVFMGHLLLRSGISERLYDGATAIVGRVKGGLFHANIVSCAIFAAVSGSSVATAATIGTVAIPALEKRGYETKLTLGSLAGGGTLGILIPPSIPLIIYGVIVEKSIGALFIAGIIPGIMLASIFMAYIMIRVIIRPQLAPTFEGMPTKERVIRALNMWPIILIIITILGGIYMGVFTPTEAAAVAASEALLFSIIFRKMSWQMLKMSLLGSVKTTTMVMFIVIGANMVAGTLGLLRVTVDMANWVGTLGFPPIVILIFIYLMYIFLGCFFDGLSMMVLSLPVVIPILLAQGYDLIWFGIALVVLIEMAALTPPVGLNLYTIHGLRPDRPISEVIIGSMPFFLLQIVGLAIITVFPTIALWLPSTMVR
jgi:tripartite ATP-independent transporter DctM subunit